MIDDEKVSEVNFSLEKISVPDKIQLHRQTGDALYSDLLKDIMKITRMQSVIDKLENQLGHEKVENKAHLVQIKKLQIDLITSGVEPANVQATQKLLEEKEKTIQVIKKKLKVPST